MPWQLRWDRNSANRWWRVLESDCHDWRGRDFLPHSLPPTPVVMAHEHPDAPKQFGIRLSAETMELVSAIQEFRQRTKQPMTLASIVEDAIAVYYDTLVAEGAIYGTK